MTKQPGRGFIRGDRETEELADFAQDAMELLSINPGVDGETVKAINLYVRHLERIVDDSIPHSRVSICMAGINAKRDLASARLRLTGDHPTVALYKELYTSVLVDIEVLLRACTVEHDS